MKTITTPNARRNARTAADDATTNLPIAMLTGNIHYIAISVAPRHDGRLNKALVEPLNILRKKCGKVLAPQVESYKVQVVTHNEFTYTVKVWVSDFNNEKSFLLKALARSFDMVKG